MMLKQHLARLTTEDLNRWRVIRARARSIEARPSNYNRQEIEASFIDEWRLLAEFQERYGLPEASEIAIYTESGVITEGD